MSLFRQSDYERESKQNKVVSPRRASHGGVKTSKQVRLPSNLKSKKVFCRNCNRQNTESAKICTQCEVTLREPKLRRKMK